MKSFVHKKIMSELRGKWEKSHSLRICAADLMIVILSPSFMFAQATQNEASTNRSTFFSRLDFLFVFSVRLT